jgi:hypothetical protein
MAAFLAITSKEWNPKPACANCKRLSHLTDYYIAPGSKTYSHTLYEARAMQRGMLAKAPQTSNTSELQGQLNSSQSNMTSTPQSAHIATASSVLGNTPASMMSAITMPINMASLIIHGVLYI